MDINTFLIEQGIVVINGPINDSMAHNVNCQLLYLNKKYPKRTIQMWINSPGGSVTAAFAIYDVMNYISAPIETIAIGIAASSAAFLLSAGTKGKRGALPNSEVLIHQPIGQAEGQSSDIVIAAEHIKRTRVRMEEILSLNTGKSIEQIHKDIERDKIMLSYDAKEYGIIDHVIQTTPKTII